MASTQQETTLAKVRLHWGIFMPVVFLAFGMALALLAFMFLAHVLTAFLKRLEAPLQHTAAAQSFDVFWLSLAVLVLLPLAGALLTAWISYAKSEITLTNRRLVYRTGFLSRQSGELPLENVESIAILESLPGRICGYGTVRATTIGGSRVCLSFLGSPQSFHSTLQNAVANAKNSIRGIPKPPEAK